MEQRLRALLEEFTYQSESGRGQRGLMKHHIDALMLDLVPFVTRELSQPEGVRPSRICGGCGYCLDCLLMERRSGGEIDIANL